MYFLDDNKLRIKANYFIYHVVGKLKTCNFIILMDCLVMIIIFIKFLLCLDFSDFSFYLNVVLDLRLKVNNNHMFCCSV